MVFDIKSTENRKIEKFYKEAVEELNEFYRINWNTNQPKVFLIPNRKEFNNLFGRETENWVVGTTLGDGRAIYLLHPDNYEKESNHKYSDKEYETLLKHEMSHLYCRIFYKDYTPRWFMEGIAIYSSGQLELKHEVKEFKKFLEFFESGGSGIYEESGWAVMILDKEFGREKLLELLKSLNKMETEDDFKKIVKDIYGIDLEYKWFNDRISKYI